MMLHTIFISATWAIGIFGVGGTVALIAASVFLGPAVVSAWVMPLLQKFLTCWFCVAAVAFVLGTTGAYWVGHHQAASECRAEELSAALRNQEFDLAEAQNAKADADKRAKQIEDSSNERAQKDADYIKSLEAKPACSLDDNDVSGVPNDKSGSRWPKLAPRSK